MSFWAMHNLNTFLFYSINKFAGASALLDQVFVFVTNPFTFIVLGTIGLWVVLFRPLTARDSWKRLVALKEALFFVTSTILVFGIVQAIKAGVSYPRPAQLLYGVKTLIVFGSYDSFPSLHAALSFMVATLIEFHHTRWGRALFVVAILVGVSRVFVGVHYPIDIVIGAAIGMLVPVVLRELIRQYPLSMSSPLPKR